MAVNLDAYEERAAIMEFDGGMSRLAAEHAAAAEQCATWREVQNEIRKRNSQRGGNRPGAMAGQQRADDMPGMQRGAAEENGPMPKRDAEAGRDRLALFSLRTQGMWEV